MLELKSISRTYRTVSGRLDALKDVTLAFPPGGCVLIYGANGSGKTTLLQIISGHLKPDSGQIHLEGEDLSSLSDDELSQWRHLNSALVYAAQSDVIPFLSGIENILIGRSTRAQAMGKLEELNGLLSSDLDTGFLKKKAAVMSDGQRRIVQYLRALTHQPKVLCVDDPFAHIRSDIAEKFLRFAQSEFKCPYIVLSSTSSGDTGQIACQARLLADGALQAE